MNRRKFIVMLDPQGTISNDLATIDRHRKYGAFLYARDSSSTLLVITKANHSYNPITQEPGFKIIYHSDNNPRLLSYISYASNVVKQECNPTGTAYISGDPWISYFSTLIVRKISGVSGKIQVQVHAEIGNRKWFLTSIRNLIKTIIAFIGLRFSAQIRTVSEEQKKDIVRLYRLQESKIVNIPPMLHGIDCLQRGVKKPMNSLGFVGRIEKDRGSNRLIEVVNKLNEVNQGFKVVVVGSGSELNYIEKTIKSIIGTDRLSITGKLSGDSYREVWGDIGVLISLSETESYGRTLRESLLALTPVWSTRTTGFLTLKKEYEGDGLEEFKFSDSPSELNVKFHALLGSKVDIRYSEKILGDNSKNQYKLVASWIRLINGVNSED